MNLLYLLSRQRQWRRVCHCDWKCINQSKSDIWNGRVRYILQIMINSEQNSFHSFKSLRLRMRAMEEAWSGCVCVYDSLGIICTFHGGQRRIGHVFQVYWLVAYNRLDLIAWKSANKLPFARQTNWSKGRREWLVCDAHTSTLLNWHRYMLA